ncbi:MAG: type IV-A pilus assembly ATPase PilB [Deltaproteobacteria bacterium]|nr:type IV-A pilus assembly ATPase PilB [Deltaproteobacteria bacterium]MBW1726569.1 type IV-A pilus assembly ATPase PilB [Deltaproteobacteria bacterium]MBW1908488.1 type IV-A pilus assembly ATPase PilB [Deltaproteobacteria bacterium]MBW2032894.1 type IV-A pilus assembly ATPase PilB [Deltaproteobacteria bacterium]MBW2113863.1 type IV-A pilus assembly ATPase PilB [Deltaproteobacteria bacterium]
MAILESKKNPASVVRGTFRKSSLKATIKDQSGAGKTRIGEILSKEGYITRTHLQDAVNYQKKNRGRLGSILIRFGYIDEETIVNVLSRQYNYPAVIISKITPDPEILKIMPYEMAKKYMAFPLKLTGEDLQITMAEPTDTDAVTDIQSEVRKSLKISVSTEKDLVDAYRTHYKISDEEYNSFFASKHEVDEEEAPITEIDDIGFLVSEAVVEIEPADGENTNEADKYTAGDAPIIKLVNGILFKAINEGVSDVHIEPFEQLLQVRYRLDGSLYKSMNLPISIKNAITSRLKILSGLNIAERRVPQDGRIKMRFGKRKAIDFRVSTLPTLFGEGVVLRILDQSSLNIDLTKLGFDKDNLKTLKSCIFRPYGLVLVTGPTGSGKTTTLYSVLNLLNKEDTKILTVEDPVEFNFRGINQVNVKEEVGMTFAAALKAFLRQDPDIIMVGEIRDMDTAEIAIKAAMTGHLVFSTLHTNDCPSTIGRLVDIGIPPYMVAGSVSMVLSQRLARKLCPKCKTRVQNLSTDELVAMGFSKEEIPGLIVYGPKGCGKCNGTGYKGRVGLYELMEVTEEVEKAINAGLPEDQLRKVAIQEGMITLRDAGLEKIRQGMTSIEEVVKRTVITKEAVPAYLVNPETETYQDKDVIFREGDANSDFFQLVRGALIVMKNGKKVAEIVNHGAYFGEMAAITGKPRSRTVVSIRKSTIKRFPGDKLPEIIEKYPEVAKHLFKTIAARMNHAEGVISKLINAKEEKPKAGK